MMVLRHGASQHGALSGAGIAARQLAPKRLNGCATTAGPLAPQLVSAGGELKWGVVALLRWFGIGDHGRMQRGFPPLTQQHGAFLCDEDEFHSASSMRSLSALSRLAAVKA
jgi:hypothetical protein